MMIEPRLVLIVSGFMHGLPPLSIHMIRPDGAGALQLPPIIHSVIVIERVSSGMWLDRRNYTAEMLRDRVYQLKWSL